MKKDNNGFAHVLALLVFVGLFGLVGLNFLTNTFATTAPAPIVNAKGKCLDNYANLLKEGNKINLYECNQTNAQKWVVNNGGAIVNANGYCLTAKGTVSTSLVTLEKCSSTANQKWAYNATSKTITSAPSGLCLDNYSNQNVDTNKIWIYTCNSTDAQKWTAQSVESPASMPAISAFSASPASVLVGKTSTLNWSVTNSINCSISLGGPSNTTATSWVMPAQATAGTKTFTLTCKNRDGVAVSRSVVVDIMPEPVVPKAFDVGMSYGGNADPAAFESAWGVKLESRRTFFQSNGQTGAANAIKSDIAVGRKTSSVSFKLPASWAEMATGKHDAWAQSLADTLSAANTNGHTIRVAFHHEPENDTGTNNGASVGGRDAWKNTQARLSNFFDKPGMQYVAILMGYHTFNGTESMKSLWSLDASIPTNAKVKGIGFDLYQTKGVEGSTRWIDMNTSYYAKIGPWAKAHNMAWGVSETGIASTAFTERPSYFTDNIAQMKAQGGSWYEYFNSNLNSPDPKWSFTTTEPRSISFGAVLKAERAN